MRITEHDIARAYLAANELRRLIASSPGRAVPSWLDDHRRRFELFARTMSECGHEIDSARAQSESMITTREKAAALGMSERQLRRRAEEFGGRRFGGLWMFPTDEGVTR